MKTPECLLAYAEELEQYYARHYPPLAPLAKPCFLSTVQTTMEPLPGGETFVITGDIPCGCGIPPRRSRIICPSPRRTSRCVLFCGA